MAFPGMGGMGGRGSAGMDPQAMQEQQMIKMVQSPPQTNIRAARTSALTDA